MLELKRGRVVKEIFTRSGIIGFMVDIEGSEQKCISYPDLNGEIKAGDEVLVNTTAVTLSLGSGGYHYILANLSGTGKEMAPEGHIMKLRYTPLQIKVLSVEEEASPFHKRMCEADTLRHIPVLVGTLHSMLAPLCLDLHHAGLRIAYVMTDAAALPISFSQTVAWLKEHQILTGTVTTGHAFGGDLEAVNVFSGLLAAREVFNPDVIIVSMGPGIVGTGTRWGFTGIEQGDILNAVDSLGGIPVAVPRISFADQRDRHYGMSHHTLTVLERVCRVMAYVPLPLLEEEKMEIILEQMQLRGLLEKHYISVENNQEMLERIAASSLEIKTMGRGAEQEREYFLALGAAARTAERLCKGEKVPRLMPV